MSEPEKPPLQTVRTPTPLLWASRFVYAESALAIGFGIVDALHTSSERVLLGVSAALFFVAYGIGLGWCARGMARMRRWARGPVLFSQLVGLGLVVNFVQADRWALAVPLALLAVGTLAGMLAPSSIIALEEGGQERAREDD